jgi:cholesterol transport system auxiliary component
MKPALAAFAVVALLPGCAPFQPPAESARTYVLDARLGPAPGDANRNRNLVLAVGAPRARAGFDTVHMAYVRRPHELEYFAKNEWADTPSRMLAEAIAQAIAQSGAVRAVVPAPGAGSAELRLDMELLRLLQDFTLRPSIVRLALQAQLVDTGTGRVLATREFDLSEEAPSDDAYGGVIAANRALQRLLGQVTEWVAEYTARP